MRPITRLVWDLAGQPPVTGATAAALTATPGTCTVCGQYAATTADADRALGANFTDRSMFRGPATSRVCAACTWCCSGKPPATLRMWTVVAAPGVDTGTSQPKAWLQDTPGLCLTNRADPAPVARILLDPPPGPWAVTVAVSGQKHVVPYGRVNTGAGPWTVRMENTDITSTPAVWRTVLAHTAALRAARHSADHVRDLTPDPRAAATTTDLDTWRHLTAPLAAYRRSPLLDLALWCCTKTTTATLAALPEEPR